MDRLANNIASFLMSNTVWVFFSVILFASITMIGALDGNSWNKYFFHIFSLSILFAPILLFSGFRNRLLKKSNKIKYIAFWVFSFIIAPGLVLLITFNDPEFHVNVLKASWKGNRLHIITSVFLLIEIIIYLNHQLFNEKKILNRFAKINLEKTILWCMAILSVGMVLFNNLVNEDTGLPKTESIFSFFSFSLQFFILLFVYYIFYWINHYILISKIFKQKGLIFYGFGFAATLFLLFPIAAEIISWLPMVQRHNVHPSGYELPFSGLHFIIPFFGMLASTPIILVAQWSKQNNEIINLEKEKSNTELRLLKQQINPHFFFNTLNNLYALSLTKDKKTPEVILQLSELMRYVIKKGQEDRVALKEEVKYIEDYIWLQRIRLHKQLDFVFEKEIENEELMIPPLLFINLVENAFKHGIEPAEGNCHLYLHLKTKNNRLFFTCKNSFEEQALSGNGTGLSNLKRRLALRFPQKHELINKKEANVYHAALNLIL